VANHLQVSEETVRRYVRRGELVPAWGGRQVGYRFRPEEIERFLRSRSGPILAR
jgi:predicted site-specific integrase-resolvase